MSGILGLDKLGSFTLGASGGLYLVTNRTAANLEQVVQLSRIPFDAMTPEQQIQWLSSLCGAYNASDLNRVENAVAVLAAELRMLPQELKDYGAGLGVAWDAFFDVPYKAENYNPVTKTDWVMQDTPLSADMQRYLDNVKNLRNAINYATDALPDSMVNLTWSGANAIERALEGLSAAIIALRARTKTKIDHTSAAWFYSGEIYSGEV